MVSQVTGVSVVSPVTGVTVVSQVTGVSVVSLVTGVAVVSQVTESLEVPQTPQSLQSPETLQALEVTWDTTDTPVTCTSVILDIVLHLKGDSYMGKQPKICRGAVYFRQ